MGNMSKKIFGSVVFALALFCCAKVAVTGLTTEEKCEALPDCEALGYKRGNTDCNEYEQIRCPYNAVYSKCVNTDCEKMGFSIGDKSAWCKKDKIVYCPTDENYSLCQEACGLCNQGETNPACPYGIQQIQVKKDSTCETDCEMVGLTNDCDQPCYECRVCEEDTNSGYIDAKDQCEEDEYVVGVVNPSCPENLGKGQKYLCKVCPDGMIPDGDMTDGSDGKTSCKCDEEHGSYARCPTGADCDRVDTSSEFSECYRPKIDEDEDGCVNGDNNQKGYVKFVKDNMDDHFEYANAPVTFILNEDGKNVENKCVEVLGCSEVEGSTQTPNFDNYFVTDNRQLGGTTCSWVSGCNTENTNIREDKCSTGRVFSEVKEAGGHKCGQCLCDIERGYYPSAPDGRISTSEKIDGQVCFVATACDETQNWTAAWEDDHFNYDKKDEGDGLLPACRKILGCNGNKDAANSENKYDANYFSIVEVSNANTTCYYVNGCKEGKVTSCDASQGLRWTKLSATSSDYKEVAALNLRCGTCECDVSKGYYANGCPEGAVCTQVGGCYKVEANTCAEGYVKPGEADSVHFQIGVVKKFTDSNGDEISCQKVLGCRSDIGATESAADLQEDMKYFNVASKTLGTKTCYWRTGCRYVEKGGDCGAGYYQGECSSNSKVTDVGSKQCCLCATATCETGTSIYPVEKKTYQCTISGQSGDKPCYACTCAKDYCGSGCNTKLSACDANKYKYDKVANAKMGSKCETISRNENYSCVYEGVKYDGFECNDGFKKVGNECVAKTCEEDYGLKSVPSSDMTQTSKGTIEKIGNRFEVCYSYQTKECQDYYMLTFAEKEAITDDGIRARCQEIDPVSGLHCYSCENKGGSQCVYKFKDANGQNQTQNMTVNICGDEYKYEAQDGMVLRTGDRCINVVKRGGDLCAVKTLYKDFACKDGWQIQEDSEGNALGCIPVTCESKKETVTINNTDTQVTMSEAECDTAGWRTCASKEILCGNNSCKCYYGILKDCTDYGYLNQCVPGFKCEEKGVRIGGEMKICYEKGVESTCEDYGYLAEEDKTGGKKCTTIPGLASGADAQGNTLFNLTCYSCGFCEANQCTKDGGTTCGQTLGTCKKVDEIDVCTFTATSGCGTGLWRSADTAIEHGRIDVTKTSCDILKKGADDACQVDRYYDKIVCDTCYRANEGQTQCTALTCPTGLVAYENITDNQLNRRVVERADVEENGTTCARCYSVGGCDNAKGYYSKNANNLSGLLNEGYHLKQEGAEECLRVAQNSCRACFKWDDLTKSCRRKTCEDLKYTENEKNRTYFSKAEASKCYKFTALGSGTNTTIDEGYVISGISAAVQCSEPVQNSGIGLNYCVKKVCDESKKMYNTEQACNQNKVKYGVKSCRKATASDDGCNDDNFPCWTPNFSDPIVCSDIKAVSSSENYGDGDEQVFTAGYNYQANGAKNLVEPSNNLPGHKYATLNVILGLTEPNKLVKSSGVYSCLQPTDHTGTWHSIDSVCFEDGGLCVEPEDDSICNEDAEIDSYWFTNFTDAKMYMVNQCRGGTLLLYEGKVRCECDRLDRVDVTKCSDVENQYYPTTANPRQCLYDLGCDTAAGYYKTSDDCLKNNKVVYECTQTDSGCYVPDFNKMVTCESTANKYATHGDFVHSECDTSKYRCTTSADWGYVFMRRDGKDDYYKCYKWVENTCKENNVMNNLQTESYYNTYQKCYKWAYNGSTSSYVYPITSGNTTLNCYNNNNNADKLTCPQRGAFDANTPSDCQKGRGTNVTAGQHNCCEQGTAGCDESYSNCTGVKTCYIIDNRNRCNASNKFYENSSWSDGSQPWHSTDSTYYHDEDEDKEVNPSSNNGCTEAEVPLYAFGENFAPNLYSYGLSGTTGNQLFDEFLTYCVGGDLWIENGYLVCSCSNVTASEQKDNYCPKYHKCVKKDPGDDCFFDDGCDNRGLNGATKYYDSQGECQSDNDGALCKQLDDSTCWTRSGCGKGYYPDPATGRCLVNTCENYSKTAGAAATHVENGYYGGWEITLTLTDEMSQCGLFREYEIDVPEGAVIFATGAGNVACPAPGEYADDGTETCFSGPNRPYHPKKAGTGGAKQKCHTISYGDDAPCSQYACVLAQYSWGTAAEYSCYMTRTCSAANATSSLNLDDAEYIDCEYTHSDDPSVPADNCFPERIQYGCRKGVANMTDLGNEDPNFVKYTPIEMEVSNNNGTLQCAENPIPYNKTCYFRQECNPDACPGYKYRSAKGRVLNGSNGEYSGHITGVRFAYLALSDEDEDEFNDDSYYFIADDDSGNKVYRGLLSESGGVVRLINKIYHTYEDQDKVYGTELYLGMTRNELLDFRSAIQGKCSSCTGYQSKPIKKTSTFKVYADKEKTHEIGILSYVDYGSTAGSYADKAVITLTDYTKLNYVIGKVKTCNGYNRCVQSVWMSGGKNDINDLSNMSQLQGGTTACGNVGANGYLAGDRVFDRQHFGTIIGKVVPRRPTGEVSITYSYYDNQNNLRTETKNLKNEYVSDVYIGDNKVGTLLHDTYASNTFIYINNNNERQWTNSGCQVYHGWIKDYKGQNMLYIYGGKVFGQESLGTPVGCLGTMSGDVVSCMSDVGDVSGKYINLDVADLSKYAGDSGLKVEYVPYSGYYKPEGYIDVFYSGELFSCGADPCGKRSKTCSCYKGEDETYYDFANVEARYNDNVWRLYPDGLTNKDRTESTSCNCHKRGFFELTPRLRRANGKLYYEVMCQDNNSNIYTDIITDMIVDVNFRGADTGPQTVHCDGEFHTVYTGEPYGADESCDDSGGLEVVSLVNALGKTLPQGTFQVGNNNYFEKYVWGTGSAKWLNPAQRFVLHHTANEAYGTSGTIFYNQQYARREDAGAFKCCKDCVEGSSNNKDKECIVGSINYSTCPNVGVYYQRE